MRLMRAVRARFARLLVRLARRLEGTGAPHAPAGSERLAGLRRRYADAPQHWLEAVARRTAAEPSAELLRPLPAPESAAEPEHRPQAEFPRIRSLSRPALRFLGQREQRRESAPAVPLPTRRSRPQVNFRASERSDRPAPVFPQERHAGRPELRFGPAEGTARPQLSWRTGQAPAVRPEPVFPDLNSSWPELLLIADDDGMPPPARDEESLIIEQLTGRWSA